MMFLANMLQISKLKRIDVFFTEFVNNFCFLLYQIIEPLVSKQWFVTMEPLAEKALRAVEKGELTIMPERFEKVCVVEN